MWRDPIVEETRCRPTHSFEGCCRPGSRDDALCTFCSLAELKLSGRHRRFRSAPTARVAVLGAGDPPTIHPNHRRYKTSGVYFPR